LYNEGGGVPKWNKTPLPLWEHVDITNHSPTVRDMVWDVRANASPGQF